MRQSFDKPPSSCRPFNAIVMSFISVCYRTLFQSLRWAAARPTPVATIKPPDVCETALTALWLRKNLLALPAILMTPDFLLDYFVTHP